MHNDMHLRIHVHVHFHVHSVRNEFEAWDDGQVDGPMPPLATLEAIRSTFKYVRGNKACWQQKPDYQESVHRIFDRHDGGGTSMSYKLVTLFDKGKSQRRPR